MYYKLTKNARQEVDLFSVGQLSRKLNLLNTGALSQVLSAVPAQDSLIAAGTKFTKKGSCQNYHDKLPSS